MSALCTYCIMYTRNNYIINSLSLCLSVCLSVYPSVCLQLTNAGEDVVVFYNDKTSFATMLDLMAESREVISENSPLR